MQKNIKSSFKVVLNSNDSTSYTGTQFNANYYVNLPEIINDNAMNKAYKMYVQFKTKAETIVNNNISSNEVYLLSFNFNNYNMSNYQFLQPSRNISYIVSTMVSNELVTPQTYLCLKDNDNECSYIESVRGLSYINLNLYTASNNSLFIPTTPANSLYVCILTFIEV